MQTLRDESCPQPVERVRSARRRREWVRGDVRCLSCSRLMGRLLGTRLGLGFFAYKAVGSDSLVEAYTPSTSLRCAICGGTGTLDDVEFLATYDERPDAFAEDLPLPRRPGRVPSPLKPYVAPATMTIHVA